METAEACWARAEAARVQGRLGEAATAYRKTIALVPDFMAAHANSALVFEAKTERQAALREVRRALRLAPDHPQLSFNLGNLLAALGRDASAARDDAARAFRCALALDPAMTGAWLNLGTAGQQGGHLLAATRAAARALALDPSHAEAWNNLGLLRLETGEADAAIEAFRQALRCAPRYGQAHANLIGALHLADGVSAADELAECRRFAAIHASASAPLHDRDRGRDSDPDRCRDPDRYRDPDRRLRIGYVGADAFRVHTASVSLLPLVEAHDPAEVEIVCYSDVRDRDADWVSERFARAARLVPTVSLSDRDLARRLRDDAIDIAVDVVGYPRGSRLLALAERPAPVQVNLLLMGSFGLDAVGFAIGDEALTPPGAEKGFSETLLRIDLAFVYEPLTPAPEPRPRKPGPVVFGSLNQAAKLSPRCLATWARILQRLPEARLLLRARAYGDAGVARRFAEAFARHGVSPERIELRGWASSAHLEAYGEIDIALDPFPYGGVITSCEALWMGVPAIALEGERVLGRYTAVFLKSLGLSELAAGDPEAYVEAAVALASDPERLAGLRAGLRRRMSASRLCNPTAFARQLEEAYRAMWRSRLAAASPTPMPTQAVGSRAAR
jgi:predicted O-linked N-acetylglucosamine transferase (SPINDLY family)